MSKSQRTYHSIIENDDSNIKWSDQNFWKIFQFYVIECPARDGRQNPISMKGKLLSSYGWKGGYKFRILKASFKKTCYNLGTFEVIKNQPMQSRFGDVISPTEFCIFLTSDCEMETLLRMIRNAFAHGNFYRTVIKKQKIYLLRNLHQGKLKAEMALCEQTLLKWIDVIKAGPYAKEV